MEAQRLFSLIMLRVPKHAETLSRKTKKLHSHLKSGMDTQQTNPIPYISKQE